mmetsp:Transcript_4457/g.10331  ORF Transcript_4457/g.10331 Transcript_4457/m.10331 type:complete len:228 (+) Transcript_4457:395-1078(+)
MQRRCICRNQQKLADRGQHGEQLRTRGRADRGLIHVHVACFDVNARVEDALHRSDTVAPLVGEIVKYLHPESKRCWSVGPLAHVNLEEELRPRARRTFNSAAMWQNTALQLVVCPLSSAERVEGVSAQRGPSSLGILRWLILRCGLPSAGSAPGRGRGRGRSAAESTVSLLLGSHIQPPTEAVQVLQVLCEPVFAPSAAPVGVASASCERGRWRGTPRTWRSSGGPS